jgi:hypothetical protein
VSGIPCTGLKDRTGTLYLARTGSRPVEIAQNGGNGKITFVYSGVPAPKAPPAADTVSSTALR